MKQRPGSPPCNRGLPSSVICGPAKCDPESGLPELHRSNSALDHDVEPLGVAVVFDAAVPELNFAQSLLYL